jgi:hypothetical protein
MNDAGAYGIGKNFILTVFELINGNRTGFRNNKKKAVKLQHFTAWGDLSLPKIIMPVGLRFSF